MFSSSPDLKVTHLSNQDLSMHFYDTSALPFPRSTSIPPPISHLVLAHDLPHAASHLHRIVTSHPRSIPVVVAAIHKHLLPHRYCRFRNPSILHSAPYLLHHLVLRVPYFYRYIATPAFYKGLFRLATYPSVSHLTRMLIGGWARDLKIMALENDPAVRFWITANAKMVERWGPTKVGGGRFICTVNEEDEGKIRRVNTKPERGKMCQGDIKASLRLLEQVLAARKRKEKVPKGAKEIVGRERGMLNDKVISILKRHEDMIKREKHNVGCRREWESEGSAVSVAKVARENARKKLSESQTLLRIERDTGWWEAEGRPDEGSEAGFTPCSFAKLGINSVEECYTGEEEVAEAMESVGDTVKLPEVGMEWGNRGWAKLSLGMVENGSTVDSSSSRLLTRWGGG